MYVRGYSLTRKRHARKEEIKRTLNTRRKDLYDLDVPRSIDHLFPQREDQLV